MENFPRDTDSKTILDSGRDPTVDYPILHFPKSWGVQQVPPFGGAAVRFIVHKNGRHISVYLDVSNALGSMPRPYWEIYPAADGDTARCYYNETEELIKLIKASLEA